MVELDFSKLQGENAAVCFADREEACEFLEVMKRRFNKRFMFGDHWDQYGEQTAYAPYLGAAQSMTFESIDYYISRGFNVIPYSALIVDDPEINESDFEIEWLLNIS